MAKAIEIEVHCSAAECPRFLRDALEHAVHRLADTIDEAGYVTHIESSERRVDIVQRPFLGSAPFPPPDRQVVIWIDLQADPVAHPETPPSPEGDPHATS